MLMNYHFTKEFLTSPVFHYTLNDDQKKQLLIIVDTALKDPEYAKCLELPKKTTPMKKKSMGRK